MNRSIHPSDTDVIAQFAAAIQATGLRPPSQFIPDGAIHRFPANDNPQDDAAWYSLHTGKYPWGVIGNWRTGLRKKWQADNWRTASANEQRDLRQQMSKVHKEYLAEKDQNYHYAASEAVRRWDGSLPCPLQHPYLQRKGISAHGIRECATKIVVPLSIGGRLVSLQFIDQVGKKRFLKGGKVKGAHFIIGEITDLVMIAEGYATAASIFEATGHPVVVAFYAGNVTVVAAAVRSEHPQLKIIICADDDFESAENTGLKNATEAGALVGATVVKPEFGPQRKSGNCDFNDLAKCFGAAAVAAQIDAALAEASAVHGACLNAAWPEPGRIQAPLLPVIAFDGYALLPDVLRTWVMDEADRMPCAPDFIAAAAMVGLGSVIGARCGIKPKSLDDWLVIPNLWGGIVGSPSAKKSPAISAGLKPLDLLIAQVESEFSTESRDFEAGKMVHDALIVGSKYKLQLSAKSKNFDQDVLESEAKALQVLHDSAGEAPVKRRFKSNDSTVEKLGELLVQNPAGLLVMRDELVGLLASWDREGREGDRTFYLEGWNGNSSYDIDRIGRGSISIPNLCISIFGGIQPDKLIGYLDKAENSLANDGMLQRFNMLVYPDKTPRAWRDRKPNKDIFDRVVHLFKQVAHFEPVVWGADSAQGAEKCPSYRFNDDAQQMFKAFSTNLTERIDNEEHPIIVQHLLKYEKLFPALALIMHLVECGSGKTVGRVGVTSAEKAMAWCEYLESHARRCYGLLVDGGLRSAIALAQKIEAGKLSDGFTFREVSRAQSRYLKDRKAIQAAIEWLEDENWLQAMPDTSPVAGRPTQRYMINPQIKRKGK